MKVGVYTLGCKVNAYESEYVMSLFQNHGYYLADFNDICDIYVINTCSVTNQSDSKSRKIIREARRRNEKACVVAMGCFVESSKDNPIAQADILIGNKDKSKIVELVEEYFSKREKIHDLYSDLGTEFENMEIKSFAEKTRAYVKIQDGCENFCSYCIIPYVRGKCRSKNENQVIEEIDALIKNGYREIILTGIHTGNYGRDINTDFNTLLSKIVKIKNIERLRISSIEITELTDEVLDTIKNNNVIVDHLHVPLQAGSDLILKRMNRKYDTEYFYNKINTIRSIRPEISITTDVIVGFPGETDELFEESYNFCKKIGFAKIHVFPYSIRRGTPASKFKDQVLGNIKKERTRKLIALSNELEEAYMRKNINRELDVLVEQSKDGFSYGHTGNYLLVRLDGKYESDQMVRVKIKDIDFPYCIGEEIVKELI